MKKTIIILGLALSSVSLWAHPEMSDQEHREHTKYHDRGIAKTLRHRSFDTQHAFNHLQKKRIRHRHTKAYVRGRNYERNYDFDVARAYRHTRDSWYLAYKYEHASFYDRHGYYYGFFNHRGYMFEGEFYRYDRVYSYRDRVKGKGLFEHRYYKPELKYIGLIDRCN